MIGRLTAQTRRFCAEECGQAMPVIALALVSLIGMCGIAVDVGRCLFLHRQLQAATDAAAMAGAGTLPSSSASTTATNYSAVGSGLNARTSLTGATMVSGYPRTMCLSTLQTQGIACSAPAYANAMQVKEQLPVNLIFLRVLGIKTITIGASATASMRGASPTPYNVAIIIDSTLSMQEYDSDCGATQMACALGGVQVLLQALSPCASSHATCTTSGGVATDSVDRVALFTFPAISIGTATKNINCTSPITQAVANQYGYPYQSPYGYFNIINESAYSGLATSVAYTYPTAGASSYSPGSSGTYQVTNFLSDYKTSDTATTLNTNSSLVIAAGGKANCGGLWPPNFEADFQTYYAGVIYAAQSALVAQQAANPGSQNVIIFLSDGDANAAQTTSYGNGTPTVTGMPSPANNSGNYPSYVDECFQGYVAANAAANAGTRVYTVAYGSPSGGCSTDPSEYYGIQVNACAVMQYMASAPQYFYSDYNQSGSNSTCTSAAQPVTSLSGIFTSIAADLTVPRLIPDNTT